MAEKMTSHGVSFYIFFLFTFFFFYFLPAFVVLISREIVCQRRSRHLATEDAGVDELPDYFWSDTIQLSLTAVIICLATVNYQKDIHRRKL